MASTPCKYGNPVTKESLELMSQIWDIDFMKKATITRNVKELAKALGLSPAEGIEIEVRSDLNEKIIKVVKKKGLTHAQVAKLAKTSRTRVTALLNRNSMDISTDLMLRILGALGIQVKIHFRPSAV